jgi:hypothetical protein
MPTQNAFCALQYGNVLVTQVFIFQSLLRRNESGAATASMECKR